MDRIFRLFLFKEYALIISLTAFHLMQAGNIHLRYTLCPLHSALCPMRSALCSMPYGRTHSTVWRIPLAEDSLIGV